MAAGRPSTYKPEFCKKVIELGKKGMSYTQIACELDVARDTMYEWAKVHPEFSDALTRARQESQNWWETVGQQSLHSDRFQYQVWNKSITHRFPDDYKEKQEIKLDASLEVINGAKSSLQSKLAGLFKSE